MTANIQNKFSKKSENVCMGTQQLITNIMYHSIRHLTNKVA